MYQHPETLFALATEHQRELIADAEHYRQATVARRFRRTARARRQRAGAGAPAGTLASCAPAAA